MPPLTLRPAAPADASGIAHVHVTSWRETYAGLMPPDFLARMTDAAALERRRRLWEREAGDPAQIIRVAERGGRIVAFASAGPPRDHPGIDAELFTLYALRAAQGHGVGRALVSALAGELLARGHRTLALWVLDRNPTRAYYAHLRGREDGEKTVTLSGGGELREVRLVWDDLAQLR